VEQGNQTPVGPSVVAQPGPFTQGLPGLDAVGPVRSTSYFLILLCLIKYVIAGNPQQLE
jgi:hypothetical protein